LQDLERAGFGTDDIVDGIVLSLGIVGEPQRNGAWDPQVEVQREHYRSSAAGRGDCLGWWLDIDAAETANPGVFVNQPLTITLLGGDLTNGTLVGVQPMDISLSAIVVKK